ncbi:MAG: hypothetical protein IPP74_05820 [Alphaproteobacteria bacterium]|nr:hypothetical protein [Alphaproteobacteria bacterium]
MFQKIISVFFLIIALVGCRHYHKAPPNHTTEYLTDTQKRFSNERFSFLSPPQSGWEVLTYYNGDITFKIRKEDRSVSLKIDPFSVSPEKFEFSNKLTMRQIKKFVNKMDFKKFTKMTGEYIKINNINCFKYDSAESYPMLGIVMDGYTEFRCLDPKDPQHGPTMNFSISQNIGDKSLELWDGSKMLTNIIKSLQFTPLDKETSPGYQHYLKHKDSWKEKSCFKLNGKKVCSQPDITQGRMITTHE